MKKRNSKKKPQEEIKGSDEAFHKLHGSALCFFKWVLTNEDSNEDYIANTFVDLYELTEILEIDERMLLALFGAALQDNVITPNHIDRLMQALVNNGVDSDTIGWLEDSFNTMLCA